MLSIPEKSQKPTATTAITSTADSLDALTQELTDQVVRLRCSLAHRTNGGGPIPQSTLHQVNGVLRSTPSHIQGVVDTIKAANDAIEGKE